MKENHLNIKYPKGSAKQNIEVHLAPGEELLWHGKPDSNITFDLFNTQSLLRFFKRPFNLFFIAVIVLVILADQKFLSTNKMVDYIPIFAIAIGYSFYNKLRIKNTWYAVSNKRVFFKLWALGKSKLVYLYLHDISDIRYEEYENRSGIIHFMMSKEINFKTYDFEGGTKRHHPSFENMTQVVKLSEKLKQIKHAVLHGNPKLATT